MSKNFELLQHISNEKVLFQTLDVWEETTETPADEELNRTTDARTGERPSPRTSLPGVLRAINETLGPLGPLAPDLSLNPGRGEEPARENEFNETLSKSSTLDGRFPISRNPITPLNSVLPALAWCNPEIGSEIGPELGSEVESELEPDVLQGIAIPERAPNAEATAISWEASLQPPPPIKEERVHPQLPPTQKTPAPEPFARTSTGENKAGAGSVRKRAQSRRPYKDARRELIAREEEFKLVQRIFLGAEQNSARVALFSGVENDGGCAAICVRAAEILAAQTEGDVCLVDADLQTPSLHEHFGTPNDKGLADATLEPGPIQGFAKQLSPANLWLLPGGYDAPQVNLTKSADRLRARVEELRTAYRYVVIHSGPLWLNTNVMLLSKSTDGVVLVLEANSTRRDTARRIKESLTVSNAKVLGVVLNNRSYPIPEALYSRL